MFDIGWTEMLVIAVVMIVVVGPKDLPKMLRTFGKTTAKLRSMAGDFQKQFNEALKEAELDDVKKSVDSLRGLNPTNEIKKHLNPFEKVAADVRAGLDQAMKPMPPAAAAAGVHTAEPLKAGATAMPNIPGPDKMPEPPVMTPLAAAPVVAATAAKPVKVIAKPAAAKPAPSKTKPAPAAKTADKPAAKTAAKSTATPAKAASAAKPAAPKKKSRA